MSEPIYPATIGPMPRRPLQDALDAATGGLTNPDRWRFDSRQENVMKLANFLSLLLAPGASGMEAGAARMAPKIVGALPKVHLPAELVPRGGEAAYNAVRAAVPAANDATYQHLMQYFRFLGQ